MAEGCKLTNARRGSLEPLERSASSANFAKIFTVLADAVADALTVYSLGGERVGLLWRAAGK